MYPSVIVLALLGAANGTVYAQSQPQPAPAPNGAPVATPAPKPQTVKKVVCTRVDNEETTGSRLGSAPKVCKTVEVPVQSGKGERGQR